MAKIGHRTPSLGARFSQLEDSPLPAVSDHRLAELLERRVGAPGARGPVHAGPCKIATDKRRGLAFLIVATGDGTARARHAKKSISRTSSVCLSAAMPTWAKRCGTMAT